VDIQLSIQKIIASEKNKTHKNKFLYLNALFYTDFGKCIKILSFNKKRLATNSQTGCSLYKLDIQFIFSIGGTLCQ